jgi:nucleoside-triphosphatase THEP1
MKVVLSGESEVGKTTLVKALRDKSRGAFWVISERTHGITGEKTGFKAVTSTGLMGQFDSRSSEGHHKVDEESVDRLFSTPIEEALHVNTQLLIIDEIGTLQRHSLRFTQAIDDAFASVAVIVVTSPKDGDWTAKYASLTGAFLLTLTLENREQITQLLIAMVASSRMLYQLPLAQSQALAILARSYAAHDGYDELLKLFKSTVNYLSEHRYSRVSDGLFAVTGLTRRHQVSEADGDWTCDCDLFEGRGQFAGRPGECSHIQTIKVAFNFIS